MSDFSGMCGCGNPSGSAVNDCERCRLIDRIRTLETRLSEITTWPLNDDLRFIFGRPNFACGGVARGLRQIGWEIDTRAEAEQAAVILWMLQMYLEHGPQWPEAVSQFWETAKRSGTGD